MYDQKRRMIKRLIKRSNRLLNRTHRLILQSDVRVDASSKLLKMARSRLSEPTQGELSETVPSDPPATRTID
jgi:hypothetical protein